MTTREQHLAENNQNNQGFASAALVFDPKQFKANKEVRYLILTKFREY